MGIDFFCCTRRKMVVIAAAVCTNTGRPIVSRQFVEISRGRIEGLLSAFTKLKNSDEEHTFIETENVRYVYQPVDSLYVVLITNKSSNIMEDLDTLHLFAKLVPEYCGGSDQASVKRNAYELIFALDEVIVAGHKEKVSLTQIKTLTEMDSHEERIHEIVERNKQREVTERAKLKMKEIEMQKKMNKASGISSGYTGQSYSSPSSGYAQPSAPTMSQTSRTASKPTSSAPRKGMQLGSKGASSNDYLRALQDTGEIVDEPQVVVPSSAGMSATPAQQAIKKQSIHAEVDERLTLLMTQDGGLEQLELKGEVKVEISDPSVARVQVILNKAFTKKNLQFRTHPNINKPLFNKSSILALRDASKSFPTNVPLSVLKWRFAGTDSDIPLNVACWPTPGNDMTTVNLEYELLEKSLRIEDLTVLIPLPDGHSPVVESADGSYQHDAKHSVLCWKIPIVDEENDSGSMEFTIPYSGSASGLFPVEVQFSSSTPLSGVSIAKICPADDDSKSLEFSSLVSFIPEPFQVNWQ